MSFEAYLKATGEKQGDIKGSVEREAYKDTIAVIAIQHEIASPTDIHGGHSTGKAMHGLYRITKEVDASSPLLAQALSTNENLTKVEVKFYRTAKDGSEENYYTVTMKNARIAKIHTIMPNTKDTATQNQPFMEDVEFSYQDISWRHEIAKKEATHSWLK